MPARLHAPPALLSDAPREDPTENIPARVEYLKGKRAVVRHDLSPTHPNVALTVERLRAKGFLVFVAGLSA